MTQRDKDNILKRLREAVAASEIAQDKSAGVGLYLSPAELQGIQAELRQVTKIVTEIAMELSFTIKAEN